MGHGNTQNSFSGGSQFALINKTFNLTENSIKGREEEFIPGFLCNLGYGNRSQVERRSYCPSCTSDHFQARGMCGGLPRSLPELRICWSRL